MRLRRHGGLPRRRLLDPAADITGRASTIASGRGGDVARLLIRVAPGIGDRIDRFRHFPAHRRRRIDDPGPRKLIRRGAQQEADASADDRAGETVRLRTKGCSIPGCGCRIRGMSFSSRSIESAYRCNTRWPTIFHASGSFPAGCVRDGQAGVRRLHPVTTSSCNIQAAKTSAMSYTRRATRQWNHSCTPCARVDLSAAGRRSSFIWAILARRRARRRRCHRSRCGRSMRRPYRSILTHLAARVLRESLADPRSRPCLLRPVSQPPGPGNAASAGARGLRISGPRNLSRSDERARRRAYRAPSRCRTSRDPPRPVCRGSRRPRRVGFELDLGAAGHSRDCGREARRRSCPGHAQASDAALLPPQPAWPARTAGTLAVAARRHRAHRQPPRPASAPACAAGRACDSRPRRLAAGPSRRSLSGPSFFAPASDRPRRRSRTRLPPCGRPPSVPPRRRRPSALRARRRDTGPGPPTRVFRRWPSPNVSPPVARPRTPVRAARSGS